jgi:hypothetical protein
MCNKDIPDGVEYLQLNYYLQKNDGMCRAFDLKELGDLCVQCAKIINNKKEY